jgi:2-keto-4-pentenoate hydratase/2-oxohepta-3-ene-1,7-dioic acid hydratase in catechol pathway
VRLVVWDDFRLGVLEADGIHDLTDLVDDGAEVPPWAAPYRMNQLIGRWDELRGAVEARRGDGRAVPLDSVTLRAPSPRPRNFLAAPLNYVAHGEEMKGSIGTGGGTPKELGFFIKASGCIADPHGPIELPPVPDRRFDHEGEIGVVIGRPARGVAPDLALEHVFGYTLVLDATMRMTDTRREERTMRKSFATFSPSGPCLLTADEVPDPASLSVRLWVDDELRQEGHLSELVVDVAGLVSMASNVLPLEPGDLFATGSPAGVGPILPGETVVVETEAIGRMTLPVVQRGW